jgi:Cdc6-like AAA superfamily ATPase
VADAQQEWQQAAFEAGRVFNPNTPIDEKDLFAGRVEQVRRVIDVINQKGQHAIIFGERGVGKTSLANVLSQFLTNRAGQLLAPRINCDASDTFERLWRKIFDQIELTRSVPAAGFVEADKTVTYGASELFAGAVTPDAVRRALTIMSRNALPIVIIDEFDRLPARPRKALADTIKSLSDQATPATIVLVGVGDSVDQLIQEHQSVARALVQIPMPRMSEDEIREILRKGLLRLEMTIEDDAMERIVLLAQGLPHYAHLIGLHASRASLDSRARNISVTIVENAISKAILDAQQSIQNAYHTAIYSARPDNLFGVVLLACALAKPNKLGFFAAQDVRAPMRAITGKEYNIPSYAQHLNEFADAKRGNILCKTGVKKRFRYRFTDPLMQPFVIMQGLVTKKIPAKYLSLPESAAS